MFRGSFPPVIMLHHVSDDATLDSLKPFCISTKSFTRLLDVLEAGRYCPTGFAERNKAKKEVVITFDDCPRHLWDFAIPELQRRGMKAVFYMPTAHLGGTNEWDVRDGKPAVQLMDEAEIKKLSGIGMEIGSHSHRHIKLGELSRAEVEENLVKSKAILEGITGKRVNSIAYPFGSIPTDRQELLAKAGYEYGLAIYSMVENRYSIRRFIYHDGDDAARLKWKLSLQYRIMRAVNDKLRPTKESAPKR